MTNWRLNRLWFWILVAVYFAIKIPLGQYAMANLGSSQNLTTNIDRLVVIALAIAVGARLKDAGRNSWFGFGTTLFITMILPLALMFGYMAAFPKPTGATDSKQEFIDLFSMIGLVPTALLIVLLIWAGTRPSKPAQPVSATKIEPRF
jgi:uncharacterized membrane protein YhaH (DUF805 family)